MRLWSIARYDLGLTPEEFYSLTPRQFTALLKRKERDTQEREFLFGQLCAYVVNFGFRAPKEPVSPKDFMPSQFRGDTAPQKRKRRKRSTIADELRATMAHFMRANNA